MSKRQFVIAKFRPADKRTYTYHNDGEPVAIGDKVKVDSARGVDGWTAVEVFGLTHDVPSFATKPILGKVEPEKPAQADMLDGSGR